MFEALLLIGITLIGLLAVAIIAIRWFFREKGRHLLSLLGTGEAEEELNHKENER